jgi:1-acyl-sn-glycerol-3-phosphate acyltransferase
VPYFGWGAVNAQCVGMVREWGHNGEVRRRFRVGECLSLQEMERKE